MSEDQYQGYKKELFSLCQIPLQAILVIHLIDFTNKYAIVAIMLFNNHAVLFYIFNYHIIVVLGVHYDIYKSCYNIS
jgi:hypothetical protein